MYYLGIDLGGTNIAAGIVDENFKIIMKGSTPTLASRPTDEIVKDMASLCRKLCSDAKTFTLTTTPTPPLSEKRLPARQKEQNPLS